MHLIKRLFGISLVATFANAAYAKDMSHRLGVGYADQFGLEESVPSLALRYYPNPDYGLMGALGLNTADKDAKFGLSAKIMRIVFSRGSPELLRRRLGRIGQRRNRRQNREWL